MFKQANIFKQLSLYSLLAGVVLSTLLVLPITDNFVAHTKTYLLFMLAIFVGLLFLVKSLKRGSFDLILSPLIVPLLAFGGSTLLSTFATSTYPVENLLGFGGVYLAMVVITIFGSPLLPKNSANKFLIALSGSSIALFALSMLQLVGFGPSQLFNHFFKLDLPNDMVFNLSGSSFIALQLALVALVGVVTNAITNKHISRVTAIVTPLLVITAGVFAWSMLPGKPASIQLPSVNASWSVALDTLRLPKSALIGVGPSLYGNAYNQFKPLWVNGQSYWGIAFNQAINLPFTLLTTMGIIGLLIWVFLAIKIFKMFKNSSKENKGLMASILTMLILQILLPANVVLLAMFSFALAIFIANEKYKYSIIKLHPLSIKILNRLTSYEETLRSEKKPRLVSPFGAVVAVLMVGLIALAYMTGRTYAAQVLMNESSKALAKEDAVGTYEKQQEAVKLNPYLDILRRRYAATNMLIAIALSNKADATEADKEQVGQLLQQAIREARVATILDPGDVENWLTLAQIYENMTGATQDAVQWAVQSYVSATEVSPADPTIRLALGGVFMSQGDFSQAVNFFQQSVSLKPDYPNGYYNLAVALRGQGQLDQAKQAYQQVLVLIDPSSDDYVQVTTELEKLEKEIAEKTESAGENSIPGGDGISESPNLPVPNIINENLPDQNRGVRQPTGDVSPNLERGGKESTPVPSASTSPEPTPSPTSSPDDK